MTDLDFDRAAWLEERQGGWGSSDMAAAWTGEYGGVYRVVADKLGLTTDDAEKNLAEKTRGQNWEEPIADAVLSLTGYYVHGEQMMVWHPNGLHFSTIDGALDPRPELDSIDDAEAILETKTKGLHAPHKFDYWNTQSQWHMHCTGKHRVLLAIATIDDGTGACVSLRLEWVERDDFIIGQLCALADKLTAHVAAGTLPEPDAHTDADLVKHIHRAASPRLDGNGNELVDPDINLDSIADDLERYHNKVLPRLKDLETERKTLEARFRDHMRQSVLAATTDGQWVLRVGQPIHKFTSASAADALAAFPEYGTTVLDSKRFELEQPEIYDSLRRPTKDRRLTVKQIDEKQRRKWAAPAEPTPPNEQDAF